MSVLLAVGTCLLLLTLMRQAALHQQRETLFRLAYGAEFSIRQTPIRTQITTSSGALVQVVDDAGRVVVASPRLKGYPGARFPVPDPVTYGVSCELDAPGGPCFQIVALRLPRNWAVYAFASEPGLVPEPGLAVLLALGIPLVAGLAGLWAWWSAGRTLRPVEAISTDLRAITATDLSLRVKVPPGRNEIARLAKVINDTLDRLEASVARQRGFVSDVSHELRSPLTGLRTELELALTDPAGGDTRESLEAALRGADRLHEVIADLLAIARLDTHGQRSQPVDLHATADMEVLRRSHRATVTVLAPDQPVIVTGGSLELARVLANLIDNADRHAESQVLVTIRTEPGWAIVEVADDGTSVPHEDRARSFRRFTRLAEGGHQDAGGTGLGLAIACEIAMGHGGTLVLADGRPGTKFILRLPHDE
jgi:signal transduction histidine kinase